MIISAELIAACAPNVASETIQQIIQVESRGDPLSLHINGRAKQYGAIKSKETAVYLAKKAINDGYTVDIGLMQINSNTMRRLGHIPEKLFDPCSNLSIGAAILKENYVRALQHHSNPQDALRAALSAYNTGDFQRGLRNGYVAKYYSQMNPAYSSSSNVNFLTQNPYASETTTYKRSNNQ